MILSDRWIRNQCQTPVYKMIYPNGSFDWLGNDLTEDQQRIKDETEAHNVFSKEFSNGVITRASLGVVEIRKVTEEELHDWEPMISPFVPGQIKKDENDRRILSYGTSSYGYDFTVAPEFKIFTNVNNAILDPLDFDERSYVNYIGATCIIPPNSFVLARTNERFVIPKDVLAIIMTKSTMARVGCICTATPAEPEWSGYLTLEFANTTSLPMKLHANMGGGQMLFFKGNEPCDVSYAVRDGKYQDQPASIIDAKV